MSYIRVNRRCACGEERSKKGSSHWTPWGTVSLLRCNECALKRDAVILSESALASLYSGNRVYSPVSDKLFQAKKEGFLPLLNDVHRLRHSTGSMLDFGCSGGYAMSAFKDAGWEVAGVELNEETAADARRRLGATIYRTLAEVPSDARFDVILLSHVLEHIPDPVALLRVVGHHLSETGIVIVKVPNYGSLTVRHVQRWKSMCFVPGQHIWYFEPETLTRLMKLGEFVPARMYTAGRLSFRSASVAKALVKWPFVLFSRWRKHEGNEIVGLFRQTADR